MQSKIPIQIKIIHERHTKSGPESKPEVPPTARDVRSTPADMDRRPLGRKRTIVGADYSIILSARASNVSGIEIPRILAVLRFTCSVVRSVWKIGKSAG
jgi:hypothetical protein